MATAVKYRGMEYTDGGGGVYTKYYLSEIDRKSSSCGSLVFFSPPTPFSLSCDRYDNNRNPSLQTTPPTPPHKHNAPCRVPPSSVSILCVSECVVFANSSPGWFCFVLFSKGKGNGHFPPDRKKTKVFTTNVTFLILPISSLKIMPVLSENLRRCNQ